MAQKLFRFSLLKMCDVHGLSGFGAEEELKRLNELTEKGDVPAMRALGMILLSGTDARKRPVGRDAKRGFALLSEAALTEPYAMTVLGLCRQDGLYGIERDPAEAKALFEKASTFFIAEAIFCRAENMLYDPSERYNLDKYFRLIESASSMGLIDAKLRLSELYEKGIGIRRSVKKAIALLEQLEKARVPEADLRLSMIYATCSSYISKKKTNEYLQKACRARLPEAVKEMGRRRECGFFMTDSFEEALNCYRFCLKHDPYDAQVRYRIAKILLCDAPYLKEAFKGEAKEYLVQAAKEHYPPALLTLGTAYLEGRYGFPKDEGWARNCLLASGQGGNPEAQVMLGRYFREGTLFPQDLNESFKYYRAAAQQGSPEGLYQTGLMYSAGELCQRNEAAARECFRQASEQGFMPASYEYGRRFLDSEDPEKAAHALELIKTAAEAGLPAALNLMGDYYAGKSGSSGGEPGPEAVRCYNAATAVTGALKYRAYEKGRQEVESDEMMRPADVLWFLKRACLEYDADAGDGQTYIFCALGLCYESGIGCEPRIEAALDLYETGRDLKDPNSTLMLAELYRKGLGVPKDLKKAEELTQEAGYRIVRVGKEPEKPEQSGNESGTAAEARLIIRGRTLQQAAPGPVPDEG